ncbi:autotransporter outer membrane beta-barrel domain-containing protein [Enterobacter mori]|uniref:autotransporter outer membrane beta-barrel domain-containing protein n=1 Tax=Enterobacter mori TaxID=539813 RepID=UPI0038922421
MKNFYLKTFRPISGLLLLASFTTSVYAVNVTNTGAVVTSMSAAPTVVASLHEDALSERLEAGRLSSADNGGVWISYFGGVSRNTPELDRYAAHGNFNLYSNGVIIGGDTFIDADNGHWLAGLAVSTAKSNLTTRGHKNSDIDIIQKNEGDIKSYSVHGYLSRQYDNGVFIDTSLGFYHLKNSARIRDLGEKDAPVDYSLNGFGGAVKVGYQHLNSSGLFAEPYVKLSAMTFENNDYDIIVNDSIYSQAATISNDSLNSVLGEIGGKLGMKFPIQNAEISPYIKVALTNEFAGGNRINVFSVDYETAEASHQSVRSKIDGAAARMGAGVQASLTKNAGAYAQLSYLKGEHREEPLQGVMGINLTW